MFGHEEDVVRRSVVDRRTGNAERIDVAALALLRGRRRSETAFPHLPVRLIERVHAVLFGRDDRQPADDDRGGEDRRLRNYPEQAELQVSFSV